LVRRETTSRHYRRRRGQILMQQKFGVLEISIVVAIMCLALTTLWDLVQRRIERIFRSRLWRRCDETARARRPLGAITI